jgi:hypothetical protein
MKKLILILGMLTISFCVSAQITVTKAPFQIVATTSDTQLVTIDRSGILLRVYMPPILTLTVKAPSTNVNVVKINVLSNDMAGTDTFDLAPGEILIMSVQSTFYIKSDVGDVVKCSW